ncbi:MAG: biotin/lipoyl-binding protein, partial [Candidatus Neomarinimicrobiota bacterium]
MKKRLILVGVMIVIVIIGILLRSYFSSFDLVLEGIVETEIYPHYSEVSGKIIELPIDLGQEIKTGDVLAVLDNKKEQYALEQLEETLSKRQAVLSELTSEVQPEELNQRQNSVSLAEIAYNNAQLTHDQAQKDYEDALVLFEAGAIAQANLDKIKYQAELAEAAVSTTALQLDNARQQLALIQKGTPQEKIDAAQADVASIQVQIRQTKDNLEKYEIFALHDGTVISKNYLLGNIVSAGFNLADIASGTEKHVVTYVPKEE